MKDKTIALIAIGSMITLIEVAAIFNGLNGEVLFTSIAALASIFGYFIGRKETK